MSRITLLLLINTLNAAEFPAPLSLPTRSALPDPLVKSDGTPVRTKAEWESHRKPELKELFQHYMYGKLPLKPKAFDSQILHEDTNAFNGNATLREIEIRFDVNGENNPTPVRLLLVTPNGIRKAPCFVGLNFQGNAALVTDPKVRLPQAWMYDKYPGVVNHQATDAGRGKVLDVWPFEIAIQHGYAVATFYNGDIQPDRPFVDEGLRKVLKPTGPSDTACLMSWAWGLSRAVDYLEQHPTIDAKKIAVVGHSRLGKTALIAGAFDDRIALVVANQAGCGGSGPSRHNNPKAETVARINRSFPHWFCGHFKDFGKHTDKLPFDQHCLVSLCAPRPVLFTNAKEDAWANPAGQFEMLKVATPVYKLLGVEGLKAGKLEDDAQQEGNLGYFIREGKHSMTVDDWKVYLKFADRWFK